MILASLASRSLLFERTSPASARLRVAAPEKKRESLVLAAKKL